MKNTNDFTTRIISGLALAGILLVFGGCLDSSRDNTAKRGNSQFQGFNEEVLSVADAGRGMIYVGGYFSAFNQQAAQGLARVSKDGILDRDFATGKGFDNAVYTIAPAIDGSNSLYVGGDFSRYDVTPVNNIVRLKSDGSYDESFSIGEGFDSRVEVIAPARDGSGDVYVGGRFNTYNGVAVNHLLRLNRDGSVDQAFHIGDGMNDIVRAIVPANDSSGDIYVAGDFTAYDGVALKHIARLNPDGTADVSFNPGSGFDREVFALALVNDNSRDIYVGGWFHNYDGESVDHLVRLTEKGELNSQFVSQPFGGEGEQYVTSLVTVDNCSGAVYVGGNFYSYAGKKVNGLIRLNGKGDIDRRFHAGVTPVDTMVNSMVADINGDLYIGGWFTPGLDEQPSFILHLRGDGTRDIAFSMGRSQWSVERMLQVYGIAVTQDSAKKALL